MSIELVNLGEADPYFLEPQVRSTLMANAAVDYFRASCLINDHQWTDDGLPFFYSLTPIMHLTIELITKSLALTVDETFRPRNYSHKTLSIMRRYAAQSAAFASITASTEKSALISALQESYISVRYAESGLAVDGSAWVNYTLVATELFHEVSLRTGQKFRLEYRLPTNTTANPNNA